MRNATEQLMNFLDTLNEQVIVLDGATGTMIQDLGLDDRAFGGPDYKMLSDLLCLSRPDAMQGIHAAYFDAGANALKPYSFASG